MPADGSIVLHRALSLKQPWATLLVHGLKTIEVRRWRTDHVGRLLIHAARVPDERPEAWTHVPAHLCDHARLGGGIVGYATMISCKHYRTLAAFVADQALHRNEPTWFEERGLYGFCFREPGVVPFREVPGYVRLFEVDVDVELPAVVEESKGVLPVVLQRWRRLVESLSGKPPARK